MAVTESNYTVSNSSTTNYSFTFPYLKTTDVKLSINGVVSTAWIFANATTIQLNSNPTVGDKLRIYRDTDDSKLEAEFFAGSAIKSSDLNDNFNQNLYVTQESNNKIDTAWTTGDRTLISTETWLSQDDKIATAKATDGRIDTKIDTALTTDVAAGNKITVTDNSPGSGQITVALTSGSLVNSDVNASAAIAGTKISPDFGSQNIATTGTVDGRDVSADGSKLDGIETAATADQTAAEIRTLVEAASDSHVFTTADHTKLDGIETAATGDQTNAEIRAAVEAATDSNVFTDADHTKLNALHTDVLGGTDLTRSESGGQITLNHDATFGSGINIDNGTTAYIKEINISDQGHITHVATGSLTSTFYTKSETDARYFNVSTGDTIKDGDAFPDNDTTIATTAAINDRIIDLVDDVGGFVPIANETSFPNANPDVNNGAGTLVSIKALSSNLTSNGSGVATIANGTVGNSTVTITGLANSTTYNSGYGMIVETTTTLNTYTFHRQVPIATEITTVAASISNINSVGTNLTNINTVAGNTTNINTVAGANSNITSVAGSISNVNTVATNLTSISDFSDVYRIASSAPTSHLHEGDLYFDTTANELKVYNGSAWQGGVTATGNLASLGANTFTGSQSLGDNLKVQLGAGNDIQIYHDTTNNLLKAFNVPFRLQTNDSDNAIVVNQNGNVELYYDNSKKFETTSSGATVTGSLTTNGTTIANGHVRLRDHTGTEDGQLMLGTGNDFRLYHDGSNSLLTNSTGRIIVHVAGNESAIDMHPNGGVELYYDNSKKLYTHSAGVSIDGNLSLTDEDARELRLGASGDLKLYHSAGGHSYIKNSTGNLYITAKADEDGIIVRTDGNVELYYNNSKKLETTSWGVDCQGNTRTSGDFVCVDSGKFRAGNSSDLQIYHDGSNNWIDSVNNHPLHLRAGTGSAYLQGNTVWISNEGNAETYIKCTQNASVELYYDNDRKLYTDSAGVVVEGNLYLSSADNHKAMFGAGQDLQIWHDGSDSFITETVNTGAFCIRANDLRIQATDGVSFLRGYASDNRTELFYDNSKKFETRSDGTWTSGDIYAQTTGNASILIGSTDAGGASLYLDGDSNGDWSGSDYAYIRHSTSGNLEIVSANPSGGGHIYMKVNNTELALRAYANAGVQLYYDDSKKFETTTSGIEVISTGNTPQIDYVGASNNTLGRIDCDAISGTTSNMRFYVETGGSIAEKLRIGTSGQIGIGGANYGTSGQVLTSAGSGSAPSWADAGGGGAWERFGAVTITSNSSDVDLTWASNSSIMTDYEKIRFEFYNIKKTSDNETKIKFFDTSGNIITAGYNLYKNYSVEHNESNSFEERNGNNDSEIRFNDGAAGENMSGSFEIYDPFDNISGDGPIMYFWKIWNTRMANATDSNDRAYFTQGAGMLANGLAWDTKICGIRMTTGTYTGGKIVAYGLKNS